MTDEDTVDATAYAEALERLDQIGREALAAEPAEAITLVREANDLVAELLPMHRQLMDELARHRSTLQAACDELAEIAPEDAAEADATADGTGDDQVRRLDQLEDLDDGAAPF